MKIAFLSDLHLDFVPKNGIEKLAKSLVDGDYDIALITGDIATASSIFLVLPLIAEIFKNPIYFVKGNHDFWNSSIKQANSCAMEFSLRENQTCKWIQGAGPVVLSENTILCGNDGFYDGRCGSFFSSNFLLNDSDRITELKECRDREQLYILLNKLGDDCAIYIRELVPKVKNYKNIIFMMHAPPFAEVSLFNNGPSPYYSLPFFACKAAGEALLDLKEIYSEKKIICLAGHSHTAATLHIDNLHVYVAEATYGDPKIFSSFVID